VGNLHGILVFLRVVEAGSLSAAARALGVSTSAVSATLARLEARLNARLLNRSTRRLSLTAEGSEFYARCKQIAADLQMAEQNVSRAASVPSGRLCVGLPSGLSRMWIVPRLSEFMRSYPSVTLEIVCTNYVPYTMEEGMDIAVQIGELHASSLAVRRLAMSRYVLCASPAYLAELGVPRTPDDLHAHRCLTYRRPRDGRLWDWRFRQGGAERRMAPTGVLTANSHEALVEAAAAGLGIVQVADYYAHTMLQSGKLVEVLADYQTDGHIISAVYPAHQRGVPKTRAFLDFLVSLFDAPPWRSVADAPSLRVVRGGSNSEPVSRRPRTARR
jgi:LysR family transcriptional regulator for bpeEF and oprC